MTNHADPDPAESVESLRPLRVVLADDHPLFRHGVATLLRATPDIVVVGEAATGDEATALANALNPDVIVMDIQMPGMRGIDATRQIVARHPQVRILMLTMFEDDASVFLAMRAGARGYVLKDAEKGELVRAIRAVGNGEAIFSPAIAVRLIAFFDAPPPAAALVAFPELTDREREILSLIAQGKNNGQIASHLILSGHTVRNYVSSIFNKLQVADRAQAIVRAREAGI
jgi:DNA-binding NarL/FixJ family response regulator